MRFFGSNEVPQAFGGFSDAGVRDRLRDFVNGAGGGCSKHGLYDGYVCPDCRADAHASEGDQ